MIILLLINEIFLLLQGLLWAQMLVGVRLVRLGTMVREVIRVTTTPVIIIAVVIAAIAITHLGWVEGGIETGEDVVEAVGVEVVEAIVGSTAPAMMEMDEGALMLSRWRI
jgi:hypothetical protein